MLWMLMCVWGGGGSGGMGGVQAVGTAVVVSPVGCKGWSAGVLCWRSARSQWQVMDCTV